MLISDWSSDVCSSDLRVIVSPKRLTKSGQGGRGILRNSGRFIDRAVRADVDEERRPSNIQIAGESGVSGQVLSALHPLCRSRMSHRLHFDAANAALSVEDRKSTRLNSSH